MTILRFQNPPEQSMNAQGTSLTKRKEKKSQRKDAQNGNGTKDDAIDEGGNDDDGDWDDDEDQEWSADVSEEAVKQRMKELTLGVKGLAMDEDTEKPETERINIFHNFVKGKIDQVRAHSYIHTCVHTGHKNSFLLLFSLTSATRRS